MAFDHRDGRHGPNWRDLSAGADEYLRYIEEDRARKPSTVAGYRALVRAQLLPAFGKLPVESITTPMVESWITGLEVAPATRTKAYVLMGGIMKRARKVYGFPFNPVTDVEKPPAPTASGDIEVFSPEEVMALVDAAASEQDAAIYLTAAFSGLRRGELIALRWRDIDIEGSTIRVRASYSDGALATPKSGKVRSVPMAPNVAEALTTLRQRPLWTADDDLVFVGRTGSFLDGGALRRRHQDPSIAPASAASASTTSATPSAPVSSPRPTSAASKSGWATPTSRPP